MIPTKNLLDIPVTCLPFEEQIMLILRWAKARTSKVVCLANVHMLIEAYHDRSFSNVLHEADLITPDGKPLVMMLRRLGIKHQNQVAGMDVFLNLCDLAQQTGVKIYLLGSTEKILKKMERKLSHEYPILQVAGMKAIPYIATKDIPKTYDGELVKEIDRSGAGIIFVCLGCPKQEIWMSHYKNSIQGVMVGVGAVFSMYAGVNPRAPRWVQQVGMEWLYRLLQEPKRLWWRYGSTIPLFIYLASRQLIIPYKQKLTRARWRKTKRNIVVNLKTLDFPYEKLGEILVRQNIITRENLKQALSEQKESGLRIGEILVRRNYLSLSQLKFYLRNQNIKFGDFLVEKKIFNQRSWENLLAIQVDSDKNLSQIILEQTTLSEERFKELFIEYYTKRKGLFLADDGEPSRDNDLSLWFRELMAK